MIRIENVKICGFEPAIRGMRNPKNSWERSDSYSTYIENPDTLNTAEFEYFVGDNDLKLMNDLAKAGSAHAKYKRMLMVYADITSNHTWWTEFDTYEHVVRNSCSKMHKIHVKEFVKEDFSHEGIDECDRLTQRAFETVINELERLRQLFNETGEKRYWRAIIELLPMGYNIRATVMLNYEVLSAIYRWRKNHKLFEWCDFCEWIKSLPYSEIITMDIPKNDIDEEDDLK